MTATAARTNRGQEEGRDIIAQKNIAHSHSEQKKGREEKRGPIAFRFNAAISPRFIRGPLSRKGEEGLQGEEEELGTTVEMGYQMKLSDCSKSCHPSHKLIYLKECRIVQPQADCVQITDFPQYRQCFLARLTFPFVAAALPSAPQIYSLPSLSSLPPRRLRYECESRVLEVFFFSHDCRRRGR